MYLASVIFAETLVHKHICVSIGYQPMFVTKYQLSEYQ